MAPGFGELVPSAAIGPLRDGSKISRPLDGPMRGRPPGRPKIVLQCDGSKNDRHPGDSRTDRRLRGAIGVRRATEIDLGIRLLVVRICLGIDPIICRRRWTERR